MVLMELGHAREQTTENALMRRQHQRIGRQGGESIERIKP